MNRGSIDNVRAGRKAVWGGDVGRSVLFLAVTALAVASAACGDLTRQGTGSSYLVVNELRGASGAEPDKFSSTLHSDVVTVVDDAPTIFNDVAEVSLSMEMKDVASQPTSNNAITVNRYHVRYVRADGRNTPGVDVPYPFDGAFTGTVRPGSDLTATFQIVRHIAKTEAPLGALARNLVIISTIAEITFYGRDQVGNEVVATGTMSVNFGDFADPQ